MRLSMIFAVLLCFNVYAHADVYGDTTFTNVTTGAQAFEEFSAMKSAHGLQKCKKACPIEVFTSNTFATQYSNMVGFTIQENYSKKIGPKKIRSCSSEIHTSDLSKPAEVNISCQTENF